MGCLLKCWSREWLEFLASEKELSVGYVELEPVSVLKKHGWSGSTENKK